LAQKAAVVQGDGGAYFVGRDVTNDIEFIFGTSIAGSAFAGATTNHDFQLRTNNVDRITIKNTTGNVGIGTSNPTYKLQVSSSSTATTPVSLANSVLRLSNSDTTNGNYASIEFGSNDTSGTIRSGAAISGIFTNHDVSMVQSELGFYTRNISGTVNEAMRIDENGNVGIGDTNPAALFTVGDGDLFQVSSTGAVTTTGGIVSLNTNSNNAVNVATGTSTGAVTIGGNANTVAINSNDWDISTTGAMTGISNISNIGTITSTTGAISLNNNSNYNISLATGTSTGTVTIGGTTGTQTISIGNGAGIKTVNLGSATTTSTTTLLSGSGGLNLNVNNSQSTNIATGTSAGAISIGGGSNTVAINSTSWDISTAGVLSGATGITSSGTINFSGLTASSLVFTDASDNLVSSAA
ncbi:MAG: hypothetical protein U0944_02025, partial [Candidatus Moranbacteria bacterium]|nr:hypothetical protein [Candidatus Moranbacteria bacterium]